MPHITGSEARAILGKPWPLIPASDSDGQKKPLRRWAHLQDVAASDTYDDIAAPLWAFPTGTGTGIVVLDFDGAEGLNTLQQLGLDAHVVTGSGGAHVYVAAEGKVRNSVRILPGMDVRGEGGLAYVVGESSKGVYTIVRALIPYTYAQLPGSVRKILGDSTRKGGTTRAPSGWMPGPGYRQALVQKWALDVQVSPAGARNAMLNKAAYALGASRVPLDEVGPVLYAAAMAAGLDEQESNDTINSGWSAGHNG